MRAYIKGLLLTIQFFSIVPIRRELPMDAFHLGRAFRTFPFFGLVKGAIYGSVFWALTEFSPLSTVAIAFIIWILTIIVTGGLHLDGWMDVSDAYFSYRDREKRLEIMTDSRIGAFGVLSIIVFLASRFLFIYELTNHISEFTFLYIMLIPFFSKICMGLLLALEPSAKQSGIAHYFKKGVDRTLPIVYAGYLLLVGVMVYLISQEIMVYVVFLLMTLLFWAFARKKTKQHFGGITGDLLGASIEGTENLLWMILWLWHYIAMG
ncbi:adenosylcobinamide-GDP ribazoletransferase [Oikeobacillus pervagus]|uniref:Adenosylcobinamide-GDP ribazoletransferase n=1 Tax=Oikeobacillus pervagus TaxID=1325931 RepID=A0AAJ1T4E2_9BACI|nr:adenosylcobinamide-GDP ribazoletransferase [Oikeobacillus pervagus]MDQ0216416.1 adenosylcobinamide-GDP ribazoletransferase [Oikeobacillus pervagus]